MTIKWILKVIAYFGSSIQFERCALQTPYACIYLFKRSRPINWNLFVFVRYEFCMWSQFMWALLSVTTHFTINWLIQRGFGSKFPFFAVEPDFTLAISHVFSTTTRNFSLLNTHTHTQHKHIDLWFFVWKIRKKSENFYWFEKFNTYSIRLECSHVWSEKKIQKNWK